MIKMGMREQDEVNARKIKVERTTILGVRFAAPLKHAAIDQKAALIMVDAKTGACHLARSAQEAELHRATLLAWNHVPPPLQVN